MKWIDLLFLIWIGILIGFVLGMKYLEITSAPKYMITYDNGYNTGALCGSKLGYDFCMELLKKVE